MRHYHCPNHSAFNLRPIFKRPGENDNHNICNFEAYFIFDNGKQDWFQVNYFIVYFPQCFYFFVLNFFPKVAWFRGCLSWGCWVMFSCLLRVNFCSFTAGFANKVWMEKVFSWQAAASDMHIWTATVASNSNSSEVKRTLRASGLSIWHCQREFVHQV